MRKFLTYLISALVLGTPALAQDSRLVSLETGDAGRGWEAVGRLDFGGRAFCTGALIEEDLVLTAGHCLFDKETGEQYPTEGIEFRAGWRNGRASAYRGAREAIAHPGFDVGTADDATRVGNDVALIRLDRPIRTTEVVPFPTHDRPRKGDELMVVSYAHDRAEAPSLQETCKVLARMDGMLVMSCSVDFGASGAPVFVLENGVPQIASVVSAKAMAGDTPVSLGTSLSAPLADLKAMLSTSGSAFSTVQPLSGGGDIGAKFVRP